MSASPATTKDDGQSSGGRKTTPAARQLEQGQKCPRCDSPNTKFCYYNNYSLTQPRHFCKTCRRYWTKGGALRNVPIGGGCRKNKKLKSSSSSSSSLSSRLSNDIGFPPSLDFHLGGGTTNTFLPFPRLNDHPPPPFNLEGTSNSPFNIGLNFPFNGGVIQGMSSSSMNVQSNLASSIESLSTINQDLHWKLQQQRLAMLFGGGDNNVVHASNGLKENRPTISAITLENQGHQKSAQPPQHPIWFQNLEISSKPNEEICPVAVGNSRRDTAAATEWFFGSTYAPVTPTPTSTSSGGGGGNNNNGNDNGSSNWSLQGWGDVQQQYSSLP